jgi:hypothetical protein
MGASEVEETCAVIGPLILGRGDLCMSATCLELDAEWEVRTTRWIEDFK